MCSVISASWDISRLNEELKTLNITINNPLSSNGQHYEIDDCLEDYHYVNYICMRIMEFLQF